MKVATANLGNGSDAKVRNGLTRLKARGVQVAGLQEAGDRRRAIESWCRENKWDAFWGDGSPGASSTPIIYDRALDVSNKGTREATPRTYAGKAGAGPSTVKRKVWNHLRVDGDGPPFVFISGHLPASLYLPGRRRLGKKMIAVLADMVKHREGKVAVIAVGDFNSKPSALLLRPLRKLGMKQRTKGATHGRRTIDLVWTLGVEGRTEVVDVNSDHRAVVLSIKP